MIKKLATIACVLLVCSCSKDEKIASNEDKPAASEVITLEIDSSVEWAPDVIGGPASPDGQVGTKSVQTRSESLLMDSEGGENTMIYMYMVEEDCPPAVMGRTVATKADGEGQKNDFGVFAFRSDSEEYVGNPDAADAVFMDNINYATYGKDDNNPPLYWPGSGTWLKFFAYTPYSENVEGLTAEAKGNQALFSYTVPTEISKQTDLMDGTSLNISGDITDAVSISLTHIMSQIKVKAGTLDEGVITSISFRNIYSTGDRIMASADGWTTDPSVTASYEQEFNPGIRPSSGTEIGQAMYLLPQTLRDDALIEIKMSVSSKEPFYGTDRINEYTLTKRLKEFVEVWEPDKIYTYVISTPAEVEVEVTDKVEGNVKSDLHIMNTGLAASYIRVAIAGSWVIPNETETYEDDVIVADWTDADGEFVWCMDNIYPTVQLAHDNKGWYKHTDGFYYYMVPVPRGAETAKLFETYTLKSSPVAGAVLDLTILAQAVIAEDASIVWPAFAVAANL